MSTGNGMRGVGGVVVVVVFGVWSALVSPALAKWHSPASLSTGAGPLGVAVAESSGDLYVGNLFHGNLDVFDLGHELIPPSSFGAGSGFMAGTAVNPTDDRLYALDVFTRELQTYEPKTGELLGEFVVPGSGSVAGEAATVQIASDANGNVYVPEAENDAIGVFSEGGAAPSGGVAATIVGSGEHALSKPTGVTVDPGGHVWVADTGNNRLEEFEANGAFAGEIKSPGVHAVAVDGSGDVFASVLTGSGGEVIEYSSSGTEIEAFGAGLIGEGTFGEFNETVPNGIALDNAHGFLYVGDVGKGVVWAFTQAPAVTTEAATGITTTGATLHGAVNPGGEPVTGCEIEYAPETEYKLEKHYGHKVLCAQAPPQLGSGETPVAVSAEVGGLEADELYHFRVSASNQFGTAFAGDQKFTAIEPVFGFQLEGPNALGITVSNSGTEHGGERGPANPSDLDTQAGSHPFDVTTRFLVNTAPDETYSSNLEAKDYYVNIPAGFAGSVARIPRCKMSELSSLSGRQQPPGCPAASQVGVIRLFESEKVGSLETPIVPVYNMVPPPGAPAELAFPVLLLGEPVVFQLRSDGDYGITAKVRNLVGQIPIVGSQLTLWGVPADPAHDMERFLPESGSANKIFGAFPPPGNKEGGPLPAGAPEVPFLTNPTRCGGQEEATVTADSWVHQGKLAEDGLPVPGGEGWVSASTPMFPDGIAGCKKLTFRPEMEVKPTTSIADSPSGMTVDLRVPQNEAPNNLATPSLEKAVVTLPRGVSISSSRANGLGGCTPAQIKLHSIAQPECPNASQVGKLEVVTPLLPEPLTGQIYLSSEREGSTFHVYLVVEGQGVLIKLQGDVTANEQTGQIVSRFDENPQLPFSDLKLTFYGGANAALATPNACGSYRTASFFEPWSHDEADGEPTGTPDAEPAVEPFQVSSGCVHGFAPSFLAETTNPVAGAFSPFVVSFSREDAEEELAGLRVRMPKGLVAKLAGVAQCSDAQVAHAEGSTGAAEEASPGCPAASEIGTVQSGAGPGSSPFFLPGKAYLTGPYGGAPYGIAVVVPVLAGPFDLGTVVVRSAISIDPHTAQVTVTSDPLPRMLDGIPLKIRRVDVTIDRPRFTLNPTSCEPAKITGTLTSTGGSEHPVASRFRVGDCASLAFKPGFKVATKAKHTKRLGAYLHVTITSGSGQANIAHVHVELPKALPSRVSTLKGACSEKQFEEDPAGCPAVSHVGTAVAQTPILATPLTGPAIFVSHGGAAFPDLDIVLQGSGITVILEGKTNIRRNITSSDFNGIPDVPVNSFELTLPTGAHSALASNGNLCFKTTTSYKHKVERHVKLVMHTTITGQNGAVVKQNTVIAVQGCGKAKRKAGK